MLTKNWLSRGYKSVSRRRKDAAMATKPSRMAEQGQCCCLAQWSQRELHHLKPGPLGFRVAECMQVKDTACHGEKNGMPPPLWNALHAPRPLISCPCNASWTIISLATSERWHGQCLAGDGHDRLLMCCHTHTKEEKAKSLVAAIVALVSGSANVCFCRKWEWGLLPSASPPVRVSFLLQCWERDSRKHRQMAHKECPHAFPPWAVLQNCQLLQWVLGAKPRKTMDGPVWATVFLMHHTAPCSWFTNNVARLMVNMVDGI